MPIGAYRIEGGRRASQIPHLETPPKGSRIYHYQAGETYDLVTREMLVPGSRHSLEIDSDGETGTYIVKTHRHYRITSSTEQEVSDLGVIEERTIDLNSPSVLIARPEYDHKTKEVDFLVFLIVKHFAEMPKNATPPEVEQRRELFEDIVHIMDALEVESIPEDRLIFMLQYHYPYAVFYSSFKKHELQSALRTLANMPFLNMEEVKNKRIYSLPQGK